MNRTAIACAAIATLGLVTAALVTAGPLEPPAGPVSSTYKTLSEVEPRIAISAANTPGDADSLFKITQRGSYYLTGNVTGVVGKHGIEIAASGVTLDLNGFDLVGVTGMGAFNGVTISATAPNPRNISVANGSIRSWGGDGINLSNAVEAINNRVEGIRSSNNGGDGISAGPSASVSHCVAYANSGNGIITGPRSTVTACAANSNGGHGIHAGLQSSTSGCSASENLGNGIYADGGGSVVNCAARGNTGPGIGTGYTCVITDCSAINGRGDGINTSGACVITNCTVRDNNGWGINTIDGCTITSCSVTSNDTGGIRTTDSCTISASTVRSNTGDGVLVGDGSAVRGCVVNNSASRGIAANNGCAVEGNLTRNNQSDGIVVNFSCIVRDNNCNGDGASAGTHGAITVIGQGNRVDGNNISYADRGLYITSGGNVVIRNSLKSCTVNFEIAVGNDVAPIGSAATVTSPWANIQY